MYFALFSVVFGSTLTLAQVGILFKILDLESYVGFRAVLNTMNVAAPFLCLGFDSSAPVLNRLNPTFPFFWNILSAQAVTFTILVFLALIIPESSRSLPIVLGLTASTSVAAGIIVANYYRVDGQARNYFIKINIYDKLVRTCILLGFAYLFHDVRIWAISVGFFCFIYVILGAIRTRQRFNIDMCIFVNHVRKSIPFIFSSLGIAAITRLPFYASYFLNESNFTAKIDIWLLFTLFILIPVLNKSKVEEANSAGLVEGYVAGMKKSWAALRVQEYTICIGIICVAYIAVIFGYGSSTDLFVIVLPLMISMILISSVPNYVQLACFSGNYAFGVKISLLIAVSGLMVYVPLYIFSGIYVPLMFVFSAIIYCLIGLFVAKILGIQYKNFIRWRDSLSLIALSSLLVLSINNIIMV